MGHQEPEPLDLDSPHTGGTNATPCPSAPSPATPDSKVEPEEQEEPSHGSTGFLGRTAGLGKAIVKAAVEADRYERQQIRDKAEAAENIANRAYDSLSHAALENRTSDKGDEALPRVRQGEGEAPDVVYARSKYFCL